MLPRPIRPITITSESHIRRATMGRSDRKTQFTPDRSTATQSAPAAARTDSQSTPGSLIQKISKKDAPYALP